MEQLENIRQECLNCNLCKIGQQVIEGKKSNIFSNMNLAGSQIFVVGQNPGKEEISKGEPFMGISGKIFNQAIKEHLGLTRENLYVCNVVNCLTPDNRKPTDLEFSNCSKFLEAQISLLKPKIVITLGGVALRVLTGLNGITKFHAKPIQSLRYKVTVFPLLHPSPLNINRPDKKKEFIDGLKKLKEYLKEIGLV